MNSELASLDGGETPPVADSLDEQNFQEVITNVENYSGYNISNHLSYFEKQQLSGDSKNHVPSINGNYCI